MGAEVIRREQLADDLRYVRQAVEEHGRSASLPPSIALVWGVYVLIGYPLLDVAPAIGGWFLMVGGILGGVLSGWLGARTARAAGEADRAEALRHLLHWGGTFIAILAAIGLGVSVGAQGQVIGQMITLVVGTAYLLAGAHFDRLFLWLGLLLLAGAIAVGYLPGYGWTALGVPLAAGLIVPSLLRRRPAEEGTPNA